MRKRLLSFSLVGLTAITPAFAFADALGSALSPIVELFEFRWILQNERGFIMFFYWLILFTLLNFILLKVLTKQGEDPNKKVAGTISFAIATISAFFTPYQFIEFLFASFAGTLAVVLGGGLAFGLIYFGYFMTGDGDRKPGKEYTFQLSGPALHFLRIFVLLICIVLLGGLAGYMRSLAGLI